MPRYRYLCNECKIETTLRHTIKETVQDCDLCGTKGSMKKLLSKPLYTSKTPISADTKVGELTQQYIEDNREILNQMKQKAKEETREPT